MTIAELTAAAKLKVRKTLSDDLDADITRLVETAISDLSRIGIADSWLSAPSDPLIVETVLSFVKANYGTPDNYDVLAGVYNTYLIKLKGDSKYFEDADDSTDNTETDTDESEGGNV